MNLFKKKPREKELPKRFEVLNCTPTDYHYTERYARFVESAEKEFRRTIGTTDADDLCADMLDYFIDSSINEMKQNAQEQYIRHTYVINQQKGLIEGKLVKAAGHLENIKKDLSDVEQEIASLRKIKEEKGIH